LLSTMASRHIPDSVSSYKSITCPRHAHEPITGIVIDSVVYDCTSWADEHPGGDNVIREFDGQDCSWQFWRFHNKKDMARYGVVLRIGRTEGVGNRFEEPNRYCRLRGFDEENW
jgi:hypothetical protein